MVQIDCTKYCGFLIFIVKLAWCSRSFNTVLVMSVVMVSYTNVVAVKSTRETRLIKSLPKLRNIQKCHRSWKSKMKWDRGYPTDLEITTLSKQLSSCHTPRQGGLGVCIKIRSCVFECHPEPNSVVSQIWKKYKINVVKLQDAEMDSYTAVPPEGSSVTDQALSQHTVHNSNNEWMMQYKGFR